MDQLKEIIKTHFELLIMTGCFLLVIGVFFFTKTTSGMGLLGKVGTTMSPLIKDKEFANEGAEHLQRVGSGYIPSMQYSEGALNQGDCVEFKSLFSVQMKNGTYANGSAENGFAIYLIDIQNKMGDSVLEKISTVDRTNMAEIPSPFVYDEEQDLLYIFENGIYIVEVKIYSDTGGMEIYEFQLPIEG